MIKLKKGANVCVLGSVESHSLLNPLFILHTVRDRSLRSAGPGPMTSFTLSFGDSSKIHADAKLCTSFFALVRSYLLPLSIPVFRTLRLFYKKFLSCAKAVMLCVPKRSPISV